MILDDSQPDSNVIKKSGSTLFLNIFNEAQKNTIVNKKGETAETSAIKDLKTKQSKLNEKEINTLNIRTERKMKQFKGEVENFIKDKKIVTPEFSELLDQYKIKGLAQFCEGKALKSEKKLKI